MQNDIKQVIRDIKSIKIQGATNIAKASIGALLDFGRNFRGKNAADFVRETGKISGELAWARPDEPLNQNLLNFLIAKLKRDKIGSLEKKISNFRKSCQWALELVSENEKVITANGIALIKKVYDKKNLSLRGSASWRRRSHASGRSAEGGQSLVNIFTHCNSSSVARILIGAHKSGIPVRVYDSETRPRFQGRILAKHLTKNGIDVTMMTDSAAPFVISENDPDRINIDLVIIGADVVGMDGSALNKIGSYSLALSAKNAGVPFYVATSLLKIRKDIVSYKNIAIEKRDPTELWQKSLKGLKVINYAFDTVPPKYIKGFIGEFGIVKPKEVKKMAVKKYKNFFRQYG